MSKTERDIRETGFSNKIDTGREKNNFRNKTYIFTKELYITKSCTIELAIDYTIQKHQRGMSSTPGGFINNSLHLVVAQELVTMKSCTISVFYNGDA